MHVYDRVHGDLVLDPVVATLATMPEFLRLDRIRQLGGCAYVYPSATHTRREHSIGTAHLAAEMGRHLQRQYPSLVNDGDVRCLSIAGLLHDVGHGPFSHMFEECVHEMVDPNWSHEAMGVAIIETMLTRTSLPVTDIAMVQLLVAGLPSTEEWPRNVGRSEEQRFLVDIVHNCRSGIDVDKLDYLLRDALAVFSANNSIDAMRIVTAARIVSMHDQNVIAFESRVSYSIEQVYETRTRLHLQVYQHPKVLVVERILKDTLQKQGIDWLRRHIGNPNMFVAMTDTTVLGLMDEHDQARLCKHPRMRTLCDPILLSTEPACSACHRPTRIQDRFCSDCSASTETRSGVTTTTDGRNTLVPNASIVEASELTKSLNRHLNRNDLYVFVCDVCTGIPVSTRDPHGVLWRDYTTHSTLVFCNGQTPCATNTHIHEHSGHIRIAYCFADSDVAIDPNVVRLIVQTSVINNAP